MWNITPLPIPPHYSRQLIGFHFQNHCWLFAGEFFEPSYWLILKREGFSGDLITNSSELRDMTMVLGEDQLAAIYTLHHRREPDHWFTSSLRSDIETLILSSRIHVFKLDADDLFRLSNHNDIYYASRDAMNMYTGDPITVERFALAEELGRDIVDRWTKKDAEDHLHWNRFVLWREAIETGDVIAEAGDTLWDAVVGLKDVAVLAIEISYEYHKVKIQMRRKFAEWIYNASRGDIDAIKSDLREMGIFVNDSVNTAQKLIDEAQQGIVLINRLLSDDITRGLIHDYLDSLYQSVPYRDSRTILPRLVFEIGLEVAIAFATAGAGNVARRTAQAAATTQQAVRASGVAKRIGPFTQKAVDIMLSLARVLGKTEVKIELPPPPKIDVPEYAKQNNQPTVRRTDSPAVAESMPEAADENLVSQLEPGNPRSTSLPRNGERLVLDQGNLPTCGPNSCAMVLDSSGRPYDLNKLIVDSKVTPQGAYMGDMAKALRNQGLENARIQNRVSIDELAEATSKGHPAVVATRLDRGGHAIVVDGITTRQGQQVVAIRDPALGREYFTPLNEFADRFSGQAILTNPINP